MSNLSETKLYNLPGLLAIFFFTFCRFFAHLTNLINFFQALHDGLDCKQYQESLMDENQDENSKKTKEWIEVFTKRYFSLPG